MAEWLIMCVLTVNLFSWMDMNNFSISVFNILPRWHLFLAFQYALNICDMSQNTHKMAGGLIQSMLASYFEGSFSNLLQSFSWKKQNVKPKTGHCLCKQKVYIIFCAFHLLSYHSHENTECLEPSIMAFWFYFLRKVQGSQKTNLGHLLHEHNKVQIITYQNHKTISSK